MNWRSIATAYLSLQAIGAMAWWVAVLRMPHARRHLVPDSVPLETFQLLLPADAILFIGGSLLSAWAIWRRRGWAPLCLAIHAGAALYAGLYMWTMSLRTGSAWISAILMLVPLIVLPALLVHVARGKR